MKNVNAANNLRNIFEKFNFKTIEINVVKDVVFVRFNKSEIETAEIIKTFIIKSGFCDVEIDGSDKKDWLMLSFIIPEAA